MRKPLFLILTFLLSSMVLWAQQRTVRGTVLDAAGNPLAGVTVTVSGSNAATQTDSQGSFSISAGTGNTLVFSYLGKQKEFRLANEETINISFEEQSRELSEVVVTALGIRRSEKALGYSVSKVDPSALVQKSEPDMLKSMQGKVAGVDIRSSQGTPGAATRIQIRGNNSFFGNSQPLIVVDGVPYSNEQVTTSNQTSGGTAYSSGISNLDPNDIASMNVLKGSAAAAVYGSRASNGVIVITTKSGSANRGRKGTEVTFRSSVSAETIANLPEYQNDFGAGSQFDYSNSNGSWGPAFSSRDSIPVWPDYKNAYPELFPTDSVAYRAYPDNVKDLFRTGWIYENSLGFNGGNDNSSVALTISHLTHKGYVENSNYERYNVGLGGATKLSFGLNIRGNFSYSRSNQKGGFYGENQVGGAASLFARSLFPARNWDLNLPFEDKQGLPLIPNGGGQFDNPRWSARYNVAETDEERFIAGFRADYNFNSWIRADYNLGSNVNRLDRSEVTEIGSRAAEGLGRLVKDGYRNQEIESNLLITLTPTVWPDFSLRTVIGHNFNQRTITRQVNTGSKFITRGIHTLQNTSQQAFTLDQYSRRRIIGVFADATLGYKDIAFLNATVRNDWSSTLPEENRSYIYPSVSGSFVFSDAFGLQSNVFDFGKVRAGWAKVGRDADPYQLQDIYLLGPNFLGQPTASLPTTAFNPNLKPEFTQEIELGTQLSFWQRLIELDFTWYNRKSTNLIATISTPPSSGYQFQYTNFGEITNKGVEVDLAVRPIRKENFSWEVRGIFTKNKNTVTELTSGVDRIQLSGVLETISPYLEPGMPFGYLRGSLSARDEEGNLLIDPQTGFIIPSSEQGFIGDPNPDFKLGITNNLTYKGVFLSALWDMTRGGDIYSVTISSLLGRGVTKDTRDRQTSWIIPGVYGDPNTQQALLDGGKKIPNQTRITTNDLYFGNTFAINSATEWNVYDATVYRLREVTLGYNLPKSLFGKLPIGSASISLTGRNLWHEAPNTPKYTNFDPEVNSFGATSVQGIELSAAPTTRRYGINLNVTF